MVAHRPGPVRDRQGPVKAGSVTVREPSTGGRIQPWTRFPLTVRFNRTSLQELAMADLAFVVTVLAAFALVALVAKGVTKL
ncbi:hypothetical protein GCM10010345_79430 [Streptomyces canarius]|uniref:Uncharacterized protein n=1 Tax=Streptomyces canarius TaxID=285453 RepID=A0ABQ3DD73_9ACTN|nr:hypothetical protein GCM10010345_79430 [Streptomyces canarius]